MRFAILLAVVLLARSVFAAEALWPGAPPDCWQEPRLIHGVAFSNLWQGNTSFSKVPVTALKSAVYSPNNAYHFVVENGRPHGAVTIFADKDHLMRIEFSGLFGLSEVKWINEKLLFMRPWWGRIAATDLIYDVEAEKVIYSEYVTDGYLAFQQFRESCPRLGCQCIKKTVK